MDVRIALITYFLVAAAAGFVTASRAFETVVLFAILVGLGIVAVLVRRQVLGPENSTRVTLAWMGVYIASFFVTILTFSR